MFMGLPENADIEKLQKAIEAVSQEGQNEASDYFDYLLIQVMNSKAALEEDNAEALMLRMKVISETSQVVSDLILQTIAQEEDLPEDIPAPVLQAISLPPGGFGKPPWEE